MDRTTTYVVIGLVVLIGIGALIYANTASVREPTNPPTSATGKVNTTPTTPAPAPATKP